jgi:translation initiation factor IF-3
LNRLTERLVDVAKIDQPLHMEGRNMIVFYAPDKSAKAKPEKLVPENKPA